MKWSKPYLRTRVEGGWLFLVVFWCADAAFEWGDVETWEASNDRLKKQNESKKHLHSLVYNCEWEIWVSLHYLEHIFSVIILLHDTNYKQIVVDSCVSV